MADLGFLTVWRLGSKREHSRRISTVVQVLIKSLFVSCMLMSHRPYMVGHMAKPVCVCWGITQGHESLETCFIGGHQCNAVAHHNRAHLAFSGDGPRLSPPHGFIASVTSPSKMAVPALTSTVAERRRLLPTPYTCTYTPLARTYMTTGAAW